MSTDPNTPRLEEVNRPESFRAELERLRAEAAGTPAGDPGPTREATGRTDGTGLDLVVRGERVLVEGAFGPWEVGVRGEQVVAIEPLGTGLAAGRVIELAADEVLVPGLVDTHVHVNEPGRTEWEGFATATRAAAAGGVTTILDMPLNSIPSTVTPEALELKRLVADPQAHVDVGFWGGAVPGNRDQLAALHGAGAFGFKCFLLHSGVDEFPPLTPEDLEDYLREIAGFGGLMIVHAEDSRAIDLAPHCEGDRYERFLASRPRGAENLAIAVVIERARWTGARAHVLHLSSSDALPMVASAKADGVDLTVETCPHYLTLTAEDVPAGATAYKCCPPIREEANRELLWQGLLDGTIDYIASDHSPSTPEMKGVAHGDFGQAWGGVASVQVQLPVVWTEARRRGIPLEQVIAWMATKPAARVGLSSRKGAIGVGLDADLVVLAPDETFTVDAAALQHRHAVTPYDGRELTGVVRRTLLRGAPTGDTPHGRLLSPG